MKLPLLALLGGVGGLLAAGCQTSESTLSQSWGKPVVVLASVSEANGAERDILPLIPFNTPEYPSNLLQAGFEGYVDVAVKLQEDGAVKNAMVVKSSMKDFETNAVATVKTWRFPPLPAPAKREGVTVRDDIDLVCRIRFSIEQYWHDYGSGDSTQNPSKRSGTMSSSPPAPERSHEMKGP